MQDSSKKILSNSDVTLEDIKNLFNHVDKLKIHLGGEESFSAQDLYALKKILEEFKRLKEEITSKVSMTRTEEESELFILYDDALQNIYSAEVYLEDIYRRHHSKLGQYYSFGNSKNSTDHELHSQKSPTHKLITMMAELMKK